MHGRRLGSLRVALAAVVFAATALTARAPQAPEPVTDVRFPQLNESEIREWLSYLSSDELQGREVFTEGYGMAAGYVADHLRQWGLKPLGDDGTYFQTVRQNGYQVTRRSSLQIDGAGGTKTFAHGDHVAFSLLSGGAQTLNFQGIEVGSDFTGRDLTGKLAVLLPGGPMPSPPPRIRFNGTSHADYLIQFGGAAAVVNIVSSTREDAAAPAAPPVPARAARGGRGGRGAAATVDITTVERVDRVVPPVVNADPSVLEALLAGAAIPADVRSRIDKREPVDAFSVPAARVGITIDNAFKVVSADLTENVVGMVEGTDARLKETYVFFGAHLDHVGYSHNGEAKGRIVNAIDTDRIWNGADDDGSGTSGLMAIAKAFATGPRPKRSVVFVWHAGEEAGLLGSRYMADHPVVPLDRIQAQFNIDMIGRNRDNKDTEANTLYVIGADRNSTDLHNLIVRTDERMAHPLTLDFEFNDLKDPNDFYTRSDHYSYASRGIPIAFFFTGTHPDYHANSDSVDKILFPKLVRVAQMIYQAGYAVAATERTLERDNQGARTGKGFSGPLEKNAR